jgi:hypothetical protein
MLRDPHLEWFMVRERQADYERAAQVERMLRAARPIQPGLVNRCLTAIGNLLVEAGERLREYALDQVDCEIAS